MFICTYSLSWDSTSLIGWQLVYALHGNIERALPFKCMATLYFSTSNIIIMPRNNSQICPYHAAKYIVRKNGDAISCVKAHKYIELALPFIYIHTPYFSISNTIFMPRINGQICPYVSGKYIVRNNGDMIVYSVTVSFGAWGAWGIWMAWNP